MEWTFIPNNLSKILFFNKNSYIITNSYHIDINIKIRFVMLVVLTKSIIVFVIACLFPHSCSPPWIHLGGSGSISN